MRLNELLVKEETKSLAAPIAPTYNQSVTLSIMAHAFQGGSMRSEWLDYFCDIARLGSIAAAANLNCMTPQGLGKSIRSLESELGVTLLERGPNGVGLSPAGTYLLPSINEARKACRDLGSIAATISESGHNIPIYVLCNMMIFISHSLDSVDQELRKMGHPISYIQSDSESMLEEISAKTRDIYRGRELCGFPLLFSPIEEKNKQRLARLSMNGYRYVPIFSYCDSILVSATHPLAAMESVDIQQIRRYPIIASNNEQLEPLIQYLGKNCITAAIANLETRLELVIDGESIVFVPPFIDAAHDSRFSLVRVSNPYSVQMGFLYRDGFSPDRSVRSMTEKLTKIFGQLPLA